MNNCVHGTAIYLMPANRCGCGQLIVSCKSSRRTQNSHHAIGVRPLMCVSGCTQSIGWKIVLRVGRGAWDGGMGTTFKRVSCDSKWKTLCGLIKINGTLTLAGGRERWRGRGGVPPTGQTLATAVVGPKAIDRSKDLNVCSFQYVDNGLSFSR